MPKKVLSSRLANLEREFIISGGKWSAFSIDDLFDISSPKKKFNANKLEFDGVYPYVVRSEKNNGIKGYINEDEKYLNPDCTISFGQDTATMFFQDKPYFTGDKIKIFSLKGKHLNSYIASYLISSMKRSFSTFSWGSSSFDEKILKQVKITIPQINGFPSWDYMKRYIEELEAERIEELEAYLRVTGLSNYHLSGDEINCINYLDRSNGVCWGGGGLAPDSNDEEYVVAGKQVSHASKNNVLRWREFIIGDLFEKLTLRLKKQHFDKEKDISKTQSEEFDLPLVNAKDGDNGIMYFGRKSDFESAKMTIDIVNDGAVSTGNVYPQPKETGVLYNAYLITAKFDVTERLLYFFSTAIKKSIKLKFGYENKASWSKVQHELIFLPITIDNDIDYDYMESLIRGIEKIVIKDVVKWTDKKIATIKK